MHHLSLGVCPGVCGYSNGTRTARFELCSKCGSQLRKCAARGRERGSEGEEERARKSEREVLLTKSRSDGRSVERGGGGERREGENNESEMQR
jgi:hypothetical protein